MTTMAVNVVIMVIGEIVRWCFILSAAKFMYRTYTTASVNPDDDKLFRRESGRQLMKLIPVMVISSVMEEVKVIRGLMQDGNDIIIMILMVIATLLSMVAIIRDRKEIFEEETTEGEGD